MVVAVEKGLEEIKDFLLSHGYTVVELDERNVYDAVVYENLSFSHIPVSNRVTSKASQTTHGVFLVCAKGMSPEEIEAILRQKAYVNLF